MSPYDRAVQLRAEGISYRRIAKALGVSQSTVFRWLNEDAAEHNRQTCRANKERYRGICVDCGAVTSPGDTVDSPHERCLDCHGAKLHLERFWTRERLVAAMQRFAERYGRSPAATDFNPTKARSMGQLWRHDRFHADGDYPLLGTVQKEFGSWSAGLVAARLESNPGGRSAHHLKAERAK